MSARNDGARKLGHESSIRPLDREGGTAPPRPSSRSRRERVRRAPQTWRHHSYRLIGGSAQRCPHSKALLPHRDFQLGHDREVPQIVRDQGRSLADGVGSNQQVHVPDGLACDCGGASARSTRKSSGTLTSIAKKEAQSGLTGEMSKLSPCLRMRTSFTSPAKRNSWGNRTA